MKLVDKKIVKLELGLKDETYDEVLDRFIEAASARAEQILGFPVERGKREMRQSPWSGKGLLLTPLIPLKALHRVVVDGEVWFDDATNVDLGVSFTDYGMIVPPPGKAVCGNIEVDYESGYRLVSGPDGECDLPISVEEAVVLMTKSAFYAMGRDPSIRSETVPGVHSVTFGEDIFEDQVMDLLYPLKLVKVT